MFRRLDPSNTSLGFNAPTYGELRSAMTGQKSPIELDVGVASPSEPGPNQLLAEVSFVYRTFSTVGQQTRLRIRVSRWAIYYEPGNLSSPGTPIAVYRTGGSDQCGDEPANRLETPARARDWLRNAWQIMDGL